MQSAPKPNSCTPVTRCQAHAHSTGWSKKMAPRCENIPEHPAKTATPFCTRLYVGATVLPLLAPEGTLFCICPLPSFLPSFPPLIISLLSDGSVAAVGEIFREYSYPLCQGVPFGQCCSPSYLTPLKIKYATPSFRLNT